MYADKDKQREANRLANQRYRERKGITRVSRADDNSVGVSREAMIPEMPKSWGGPETYEAWSPSPVVKKDFVVDDKPVPSWRVEKDRQMAEFLKRHRGTT